MALETQKGLPRIEKLVVDGAMGAVTVEAVLHQIGMFIKVWTSLVGMTLDTGFFDAVLEKILVCESAMRVVAVNAKNTPLLERMVAGQEKLHLGVRMAGKTKLTRCQRCDFQIGTGVNIMAVKTGYFIYGMQTRVPVMEIKGCIGGVALEAY